MSYDIVDEDVPGFVRRVGDHALQGSNNTLVVLGTDRPGDLDSGLGDEEGAGTIHLVAGRRAEDPSLIDDDSYLYLTMKSDLDANLGLEGVETPTNRAPGAVLKSDVVRVIYRRNLKVCLTDGKNYIYMDDSKVRVRVGSSLLWMREGLLEATVGTSNMRLEDSKATVGVGSAAIELTSQEAVVSCPLIRLGGEGAQHLHVLGEKLQEKYNAFVKEFVTHKHPVIDKGIPTGVPAGGVPVPLDSGDFSQVVKAS